MKHYSEESYVTDLIERLKPFLPMTVTPGKILIAHYKRMKEESGTGLKLKKEHKLTATSAVYIGSEGGLALACDPPVKDSQVMLVSITHLKLDPKHPLYKELRAYQIARTDKLIELHGERTPPISQTFAP